MKTVVVGLLQGPVAWLSISAAISLALQVRAGAQPTGTIGVSLLAGAGAWASVGLLIASIRSARERAAILQGAAGMAPRDGARAVLVGTLEATGPVLRAPLDDSPCVAYSYEITDDRGQGKRRHILPVFRGVGLTPSMIVTRTGSYRLLVVPDLDAAVPVVDRAGMIEHFRRYAQRTTFQGGQTAADERLSQWSDADGEYRSDVAYGKVEIADTSHWVLQQQHVPPGSRVCVFGRYSQEQRGVVPMTGPTRLMRGGTEEVAAVLRSTMVTRGILGLALGASAAGVVGLFLGR